MTYKESYMECTSEDELLEKGKKDIEIALLLGSSARVKIIKQAMEEVISEKFSKGGEG